MAHQRAELAASSMLDYDLSHVLPGSPPMEYRARGRLRHTAGLLSPMAATAARLALERDRELRLHRLTELAGDRARQRLRPTRLRIRALIAAPGGRLSWREVPVPPPPGPYAAVVRPAAIATCDIDRPIALGATPFPLPLNLGHEYVAEAARCWRAGHAGPARAAGRGAVPDQLRRLHTCRQDRTGNCSTVPPLSMYGFGVAGGHWGGAVADRLAVPYADAMLVPLPEAVDAVAAASVADNVSYATSMWAAICPVCATTRPR